MTGIQQIRYSPNNIYANDYYRACDKFENIRDKVIKYEHSTDDRESPEYLKMVNEFEYWDAKVPETSNIAGKYEDKLKAQEQEKQQAIDYNQNREPGSRLNILA